MIKIIQDFILMLLFKELKDCLFLIFNNTSVNVAGNPINNINNRVVRDSHRKYFLPRLNVTNYNVLIDGNQPINDQIKNMMKLEKLQEDKEMIIL